MSAAIPGNWNAPPPTYDAHSTSYMTTTLTPYLQLPHLLSLTWLAYPILSLIFVAFRLQLSLADAQSAVASAKTDLLASCKAAEEAATSAASMPRYMALATNEQFADAVNGSMAAARGALVLALTGMEAIINFIVDIYRSTFLCFLELVVRGGLAILIGAVQEVNNLVQTVTSGLRTSIQNDISSANNVIKSAIDTINKVNPFGNINVPQIAVPSLDGLQNVTLPPSFEQALVSLNASIPSVADIKGKLEDVIDTPFELLKKDINDTFASLSFHPSGLPVPGVNRLSFCNDLDMSVVDDIGRDFLKTAKIGVLILILLALLLVGLNCLLTWYKWRCMKNHLEYTRQAWMTDPTIVHTKSASTAPQVSLSDHNLMMLQANSEHPLITRITNQLSARFRLSPSQHSHMQWFFRYIFHAPALACFLIGFFGLLSVQIQLIAMGPLVAKYQDRAAATVSDFSNTIATSINDSMYNQSSAYANEINAQVDTIQSSINNGVFGWVNDTTTTLNTTINTFYTDIENAVATVFNGTILESPANDFLRCFLGSKVDAIENALTFLHDNLKVDMPRVNQSVLILSPASVNEATAPIAAAAIGGGQNDNEGLIGRLVNAYAQSLRKERLMFGIFIALWGFVVLMGIVFVLWHSYGKPYLEQRRRRKWEAERSGIEDMFPSKGSLDKQAGDLGAGMHGFRSFTPLPSPRGSAFKPFWSSRSNSPEMVAPSASSESPSAPEFSRPREPPPVPVAAPAPPPKRANKLISIGRKALGRERLVKDEEAEQPHVPLSSSSDSVGPNNGNTAWYWKMGTLLARKDPKEDADLWDQTAMDQPKDDRRPKLLIYTQKALDKRGPPQSQQNLQAQSRWSTSPPATQTGWMSVMSPTKKPVLTLPANPYPPNVVVSPASDVPPYRPPPGIPIRSRQNPGVPVDVGSVYEDSSLAQANPPAGFPIPLHNGFDSQQRSLSRYPTPPRHTQSGFNMTAAAVPPPPPLKSPQMFQPPASLAPPRNTDQHRRSSSMGTATWRITNATPGDAASLLSSSASLNDTPVTPATRLLTTVQSREPPAVNPFITPFDDEHRVKIDHPDNAHLRKSISTNPFAVAI